MFFWFHDTYLGAFLYFLNTLQLPISERPERVHLRRQAVACLLYTSDAADDPRVV